MQVILAKDYTDLSRKGASIVIDQIAKKKDSVLGFATGDTQLGLYQELVEAYNKGVVGYKDVVSFNLDEYIGLGSDDQESYHYYMYENYFKHVDFNMDKIYIPDGLAQDLKKECELYERRIKNCDGIDLVILGIGVNAHIGFNEPGSDFDSRTRIVDISSSTINENAKHFKDIKKIPTRGITMGIGSMMEARKILLIASGKKKAEAIYNAVKGRVTEEVPASALQRHKDVTVIVDKGAGGLL